MPAHAFPRVGIFGGHAGLSGPPVTKSRAISKIPGGAKIKKCFGVYEPDQPEWRPHVRFGDILSRMKAAVSKSGKNAASGRGVAHQAPGWLPWLCCLALPWSALAQADFEQLQYNPRWYRTYDSTSSIVPNDGSLLFNWAYGDSARHPDSFYVGIDTLWILPRNIGGDSTNNWDLQVCPDGFCMNGVNTGVFGADAPLQFGDTGQYGDTSYQTEHHFQFFPAVSPTTFQFTAPDSSVVGGMMYVRSRSTGAADTVFGFGAWNLPWDSTHPPPLHPVNGYLPKRSDFTIVDGMVRYLGPNTAVAPAFSRSTFAFAIRRQAGAWVFSFAGLKQEKRIALFGLNGNLLWRSHWLSAQTASLVWNGNALLINQFILARLQWPGGDQLRVLPAP